MPALIKGVILKKRESMMGIKLVSGKRFWTYDRKDLDIWEFVWVGWDYTKNRPTQILSTSQLLTWTENPEHEEFSIPDDEGFEGNEAQNLSDKDFFKQMDKLTDDSEETEHVARSFSNPKDEKLEDTEYEVRSFSDPFNEG